jgi:hypothetical protein
MQSAFGTLLFAVVGISAVVALVTFAGARRAYGEIGKGLLSLRDGTDRPAREPVALSGPAARAEQEAELRQMLGARNAVRERAGRPLLDIESELAALLTPAPRADPALEAEVRDLVIARNARRGRAGRPPLDVEAEVARQLAELG